MSALPIAAEKSSHTPCFGELSVKYGTVPTSPATPHALQPIGSVLTLWEQGHIVDRGRSKAGEAQRQSSYGIVNPLTLAQVLPGTNAEKPERPIR